MRQFLEQFITFKFEFFIAFLRENNNQWEARFWVYLITCSRYQFFIELILIYQKSNVIKLDSKKWRLGFLPEAYVIIWTWCSKYFLDFKS